MRSALLLVALALAAGCTDQATRTAERQKEREKAKKALEDAAEAKRLAALPKVERAKLEPFWDDPAYLRASTGKPCPEGLWALFPATPGEGAEQAAHEAQRQQLVAKVRAATFVTNLPFSAGTAVRKFNAKKKRLMIEVDGLVECTDPLGVISLAWGEPAKAIRPPAPDEEDEFVNLSQQAVWRAQPLLMPLAMGSAAEAKAFKEKQGIQLESRLVYTLGKVDQDKKETKTKGLVKEDGGAEDGVIDWGAGRLVHVTLKGVRISADHEKALLIEKRF